MATVDPVAKPAGNPSAVGRGPFFAWGAGMGQVAGTLQGVLTCRYSMRES